MKLSKTRSTGLAGLALFCLMSWSAQAEPDKPCKGKDCSAAKSAKAPAASAAVKLNKNTAASRKAVRDDPSALRSSNASKGAMKNAPAGQKPNAIIGPSDSSAEKAKAGKPNAIVGPSDSSAAKK